MGAGEGKTGFNLLTWRTKVPSSPSPGVLASLRLCVDSLQIQRAANPQPWPGHHVRVDLGHQHARMPQQFLHCPDVVSIFQQPSCKTVAQAVATGRLGDAGQPHRVLDRPLQALLVGMVPPHPPLRGSREKCAAGNTYCQPHSRSAAGYFWLKAYGKYTRPLPSAKSFSCNNLTRFRCSPSPALRLSGNTVIRSLDPLPSRTTIWFWSKSTSFTRSRGRLRVES